MFSRALVFSLLIAIAMVSISMIVVVLGIYGGTTFEVAANALNKNNKQDVKKIFKPCDIDSDGDCDAKDYNSSTDFLGLCAGRNNYRKSLDVDKDGCITEEDLQKLFPSRH